MCLVNQNHNINDSNSINFRGIVTGGNVRTMKKMNRVKFNGSYSKKMHITPASQKTEMFSDTETEPCKNKS